MISRKHAPFQLFLNSSRTFSLLLIFFVLLTAFSITYALANSPPPPIVYTIAGSDSGGGAGIQADLHAIQSMKCHGCSAITCLTAQNSVGVTGVYSPPADFLRLQLETLWSDLPARAIKIGMIGSAELAMEIGQFLQKVKKTPGNKEALWVVVDPVMISTSGCALITEEAKKAMVEHVFPYADVLTPNKFEAEALLGRTLTSVEDVEQGISLLMTVLVVIHLLASFSYIYLLRSCSDWCYVMHTV